MDHAWIAGGDPDSLRAQRLYQNRVLAAKSIDTNVFTASAVTKLTDLYTELDFTSTISKPIGDLLLISHGNDMGWMSLDLDAAAGTSTTFEELHDILDPANVHRLTSLRIPPDLYETAPNTPGPTRVIIGGCRVGKAPKFVDALKLVLGGKLPVLAPRHYHMFVDLIETDKAKGSTLWKGTYELLCYAFEANALQPFKKPAELTKAMADNPKNVTIDGHRVTQATMAKWLGKTFQTRLGKYAMPVRVPLGRKIAHQKRLSPGELRLLPGEFKTHFDNPSPAQRTRAGMKAAISQRPEMQPAFGFPIWEQYGHANFEEFFNAFNWKLADATSDPARWFATRVEYIMLVPITSLVPADKGKLLYNFFPPRGSTASAFKELDETDPALYYRTA